MDPERIATVAIWSSKLSEAVENFQDQPKQQKKV
jgi:hypothetical protein